MTDVAVIGLGSMGSRMAACIARDGHRVSVFNRDSEKARRFAATYPAQVATTPGAAAGQSTAVITMVSDAAATSDVYSGDEGVLAALRPGMLCIVMSTIAPSEVRELGEAVTGRGASLIDAPVSGSIALADAGELTLVVGGDVEDVDRARPLLDAMASKIYHVGPLGAGATIKLAVNAIVYSLNQAVSEALVVLERNDIAREVAYEVIANSAVAAPFVHYRRTAFERPRDAEVACRLPIATKDILLYEALAIEAGIDPIQSRANLEVLKAAIAAGYEDHDVASVAEFLRDGPVSAE